VKNVTISDDLLTYITALTEKTRTAATVVLGVSTRGAIALSNICRAYAALNGRAYVLPDDIQYLLKYAYAHRIICRGGGADVANELLEEIIKEVKVPSENY
jgi:MoxR-like ATPase